LFAGDGAVLDLPLAAGPVDDLLGVGVPALEGLAVEEWNETVFARRCFRRRILVRRKRDLAERDARNADAERSRKKRAPL